MTTVFNFFSLITGVEAQRHRRIRDYGQPLWAGGGANLGRGGGGGRGWRQQRSGSQGGGRFSYQR